MKNYKKSKIVGKLLPISYHISVAKNAVKVYLIEFIYHKIIVFLKEQPIRKGLADQFFSTELDSFKDLRHKYVTTLKISKIIELL